MDARVSDAGAHASFAAARLGQQRADVYAATTIVPHELFPLMVRNLWPVKGAAALMEYCGIPERTARAYQRGDREPCMSVLWLLLTSREGYRVLSYIADSAKPDWWTVFKRERELAALATEIFERVGALKS